MQTRSRRNGVGLLFVVAVAATLMPACNYRQLQQDREALMRQNQELQAQNSAVMDENDRLARQPLPPAVPTYVPPPPGLTLEPAGFESIEGLEIDDSGASELKVSVPGDLLFAAGKAELTRDAKKTVDEVAGVLNGKHAGSTVGVIGHTDSDPIKKSKWASNEALSLARAQAVADQLAAAGVARGRLETRGVGAQQPRGGKKSGDRRVEIVVSK